MMVRIMKENGKAMRYKSHRESLLNEKKGDKEMTEPNREILAYIRERDEAKEELKKIKDELSAAKSKLYDANNKIEDLQHSLSSAQKKLAAASGKNSSTTGNKGAPAKKGGAATKGGLKAPAKASPATSSTNVKEEAKSTPPPPKTSHRHPPIEGKLHLSEDTVAYYTEVAEHFPNLKLGQVLEAEKKFNAADDNGDGVIDKNELDMVLRKHDSIALFTPQQVEGILTEIDKDNTGTLDFFEVLSILDRFARRKTNKPELQGLQQHQAKVCAIQ